MYKKAITSSSVQGQSTFGGPCVEKETSVTIPPEVSIDVAALQSVLFWTHTGRLMNVAGLNIEGVVQHKKIPAIGYTGDLLQVYKIAKFLEIEQLATALLEDGIDIFTEQNLHEDIQRQLSGLLLASQHTDGVVDWYPLYSAVCHCLASKYVGVAVLAIHPFAYTRHTWEMLWDLCAPHLCMWGDLVDLFFVLFETPETQIPGAYGIPLFV
jgi:hypothetical protein